jgi:hypothetical protein
MEFDLSSPNLMHRLNSMNYNSNPSVENPNLPFLQNPNSSRISTEPLREIQPDVNRQMLNHSFSELKDLLTEICQEGNNLLQKFQTQVPSTNLQRLESMIPRLNEVSDKLSRELNLKNYGEKSLNGKRELKIHENEDDEMAEELRPVSEGYKKIKQDPIVVESPELIIIGTAFSVRFICHHEIQRFVPPEKQYKYAEWSPDGTESVMIFKREDFLSFPHQVTLRLSKEHAKITAKNRGSYTTYELTDLSMNGIYYAGNRVEESLKENPLRLQKGIPFRLKHGDWIYLLLKKDTKTPELLLGFEFLQG